MRILCDPLVEWFTWDPLDQIITLAADLEPRAAREATALALAHRALGHWGNLPWQDVEARDLAFGWLISDAALRAAVAAHDPRTLCYSHLPACPEIRAEAWVVDVARALHVTIGALAARLGVICEHTTNVAFYRGDYCPACPWSALLAA